MGKPAASRARQEARYRRRRQALLISSCLFMGAFGGLFGVLGRNVLASPPSFLSFGKQPGRPQSILVLGIDDNYDPAGKRIRNERARTDTIMLVTVLPEKKRLHVLSIPRDTKVLVPEYGTEKINAAHSLGGTERTKEVVENLTGLNVDHVVEVSLSGAISFLDSMGGVDVFVENPMHYTDHTAKLFIDLQQGWQHLDGKTSVGFARFRHDALGDIGRVARQQHLMHAVEQKLLNPINWWRLPQMAAASGKLFTTDLSAGELGELATFAKNRPAISYTTLPGDFGYSGYWIPNRGRIETLVAKLTEDAKPAKKDAEVAASVEILYGPQKEQAATKVASALSERGLLVVRTAPASNGTSTATRIIGRNGNPAHDPALASLMPNAPWQMSDDTTPYSADYTLVIGPDYR
ncbi:MAG TPA: LCP family protein [Pantanalinema sp.]